MWTRSVVVALLDLQTLSTPRSAGPSRGTLLVDGGGGTDLVKNRFVAMAGGKEARIVVIPTGASALRFGPAKTILNPDWARDRTEWAAYQSYLTTWLGTDHVTVLHTRDRAVADSEEFVKPLRTATGVFLGAGNAGRIAEAYLGTRTEQELQALLRGGRCSVGQFSRLNHLGIVHCARLAREASPDGARA